MLNTKKITIVGCGTVGSLLAYKLVLSSIQNETPLEKLYLIDNDSLDDNNLPYLTLTKLDFKKKYFLGKSKSKILNLILQNISPKLDIHSIYDTYPLENVEDGLEIYDTLMIDCRDNSNSDGKFFMKINIDGEYASIKLRPKKNDIDKSAIYSFGNSRYYADLLASICCHILFHLNLSNNIQEEYLLNFGMGGNYVPWFNNFIRKS